MILYFCSLSVFFSFGLSQEVLVEADDGPLYAVDHTINLYSEPSEECDAKTVLCGLQPAEQELIVSLHNTNRRMIGAAKSREESMKELAWNEELAKTAQLWGDQCTLGHDKRRGLLWQGARLEVGQYVYFGYSRLQDNVELVEEIDDDLVDEISDEVGIDDGSDVELQEDTPVEEIDDELQEDTPVEELNDEVGIDDGSNELQEDTPEDSDLSRDVLPDMITRAVDNWFAETSQEGRDYISIESLAYPVSDGSYWPQPKYCDTSLIGCGLTAYQEAEYPGWLYTLIVCNYAVVQPEELPTTPVALVDTTDGSEVDVDIGDVEQVPILDDDKDTSEVQSVEPAALVDTTDASVVDVEEVAILDDDEVTSEVQAVEPVALVDTTDASVVDVEEVPILDDDEDTSEVQAVEPVALVDTTDASVVDVDTGDVEQVPILDDDDEDTSEVQALEPETEPEPETEDISVVQADEPDVVEVGGSIVDDDADGSDMKEGSTPVTVEDADDEVLEMLRRIMLLLDGKEYE
eukprot:GFUD01038437.1.p1 GENE.GFUD01038437.1~~GFUD01038437.1.p1  ORF type:complete len:520 (+),score=120.89 GFUD01038437.1:84-1643(+)